MKKTKFEDTPQYKKGKLGEQLVREMIIKNGWVVYTPSEGQAHAFDILATKNKTRIIAIDVKTKARLNKWEAQGINRRTYIEYCYFSEKHNIPFYLVFVDDKNGEIHAVNIAKLHKLLSFLFSMIFLTNCQFENSFSSKEVRFSSYTLLNVLVKHKEHNINSRKYSFLRAEKHTR